MSEGFTVSARQTGRPAALTGDRERECYELLERLGIAYEWVEFSRQPETTAEAEEVDKALGVPGLKNLIFQNRNRSRTLFLLLPPAFWLGVWQLGAWLVELHVEGRGNELLLPYPVTVLLALLRLARSPEFWWTALASLARVAAGMAGGAALGVLLAALACASPWCRRLFAPVIRIIRATPVVSFILLVLLWTGRDLVPAVIAGLMVLPVVWENVTQGLRATDGQLLELARAYRFSRWKTVRLVYLPSLRPYLRSAAANAMGLAWKSGVAAEVLCLPRLGIGAQISRAKQAFETADLFAWTAAVILLSLLMERALTRLIRHPEGGSGL